MSENPPTPPGQPEDPYRQQPGQQPGQQPQQPAPGPQGGQQPFYAAAAASAANVARHDTKGFFGSLFDYSFMHYVTPKVVKIIYVVLTVLIALGWLGGLIAAFSNDVLTGILFLLFGWIVALVYLALARVSLEVFQAVVSISEKINSYAERDGML